MAYIDREEAIKHIEIHIPYRCADDFIEGQRDCINQLKSLPAADVVEVVRCKDCRNRYEKNWAKCVGRKPDDFCSDGERKYK